MAKVIQMFSNMDEDMKNYHKKIWKHRAARIGKYVIAACVVLIMFWAIRYYLNNRSFSGYSISSSSERSDTLTTEYESFGGNILKYSRDGISYTDQNNRLFFSITYTMQSPIVALSNKAGAVADKNGTQIYIFDRQKQRGQIDTLLPIKDIAISDQGIVAVLLEESSASKLEMYSADGELLGDGIFSLDDTGYPMDLSISSDGTKIALAFSQVSGSNLHSCVAVYNFDNVGENYVDHLVFAKNYSEYIIPEIHYFDSKTLAAVGDGMLAIYRGSQIPEIVKEITFEEQIKSVFYGEDSIGLVFNAEEGSRMEIYDLKGKKKSEISFDLDYTNIHITDQSVVVYNDTEFGLYSLKGKECFRHTFDTAVLEIFPTNSRNKYVFIYTNETQLIKLQ